MSALPQKGPQAALRISLGRWPPADCIRSAAAPNPGSLAERNWRRELRCVRPCAPAARSPAAWGAAAAMNRPSALNRMFARRALRRGAASSFPNFPHPEGVGIAAVPRCPPRRSPRVAAPSRPFFSTAMPNRCKAIERALAIRCCRIAANFAAPLRQRRQNGVAMRNRFIARNLDHSRDGTGRFDLFFGHGGILACGSDAPPAPLARWRDLPRNPGSKLSLGNREACWCLPSRGLVKISRNRAVFVLKVDMVDAITRDR